MSICHLGVMGTREFRVSDPEPKNYVVPIGNSASIQIAYPEFSEEASSTWNLSLQNYSGQDYISFDTITNDLNEEEWLVTLAPTEIATSGESELHITVVDDSDDSNILWWFSGITLSLRRFSRV